MLHVGLSIFEAIDSVYVVEVQPVGRYVIVGELINKV